MYTHKIRKITNNILGVFNIIIFSFRGIRLPAIQKAVNTCRRGRRRASRGGHGRGGKAVVKITGTEESEETQDEPLSSEPSILLDDDKSEEEVPKPTIKQTAPQGRPFCSVPLTCKTPPIQKCTVSLDKNDAENQLKTKKTEDDVNKNIKEEEEPKKKTEESKYDIPEKDKKEESNRNEQEHEGNNRSAKTKGKKGKPKSKNKEKQKEKKNKKKMLLNQILMMFR